MKGMKQRIIKIVFLSYIESLVLFMNNFKKKVLRKIKRWFNSKNIRGKIHIIYIILIIGQLFIITFTANYISNKAIVSSTIKQSNQSSQLVVTNIENILENTESYANDLTVKINNYFVDETEYKSNEYSTNMIFKKIFRNAIYVYPRIYSVLLFLDDNESFFADNVTNYTNYQDIIKEYAEIKKDGPDRSIWLEMKKNDLSNDVGNKYVLTLCKGLVNIDTGKRIGLLAVVTSENTFSNIYKNMGMGKTGSYFICDKNGVVVSSANRDEILKPVKNNVLKDWIVNHHDTSEILKIDGKNTLVTSYYYQKLGWRIVGMVPLYEITQESRKISMIIIITGVICMISAIALSSKLSSTITKPLNKLIEDIKNIELQNLSVPIQINAGNDIGVLVKNFNRMKQRISELMSDTIAQQEKQKKYELRLLQAQIRPHFLYNTLQLIYSMIEMDNNDQAKKASKALADYYRIALSNGNEIISLEEEIKYVESYLLIQKMRYEEAFVFNIDIPKEYNNYKILKLTLQPIVENSIKHGLINKYKNDGGRINIKASKKGDILVIEITDNGIGMKPEIVQHLFDKDLSGNKGHFGLKNIDDRIKLFYGCNYGITVTSIYMESTTVSLLIPVVEELDGNLF